MLNKVKKSDNRGFTIIEVMIVLAIAGLIILIVLLAVPALQRNSRNTAIKNDASAIAGAVSEFGSNNDGATPLAANSALVGSAYGVNNATGTAAPARVQSGTNVTDIDNSVALVTPTPGNILVDFGAKCPATVTGTTVTPVLSRRATAIIYATEAAGGNQARCLDA